MSKVHIVNTGAGVAHFYDRRKNKRLNIYPGVNHVEQADVDLFAEKIEAQGHLKVHGPVNDPQPSADVEEVKSEVESDKPDEQKSGIVVNPNRPGRRPGRAPKVEDQPKEEDQAKEESSADEADKEDAETKTETEEEKSE